MGYGLCAFLYRVLDYGWLDWATDIAYLCIVYCDTDVAFLCIVCLDNVDDLGYE